MKSNQSKFFFVLILFLGSIYLYADELCVKKDLEFHTVYRDDKVYETSGTVMIHSSMDALKRVLLDFQEYKRWILHDLTRNSPHNDKLPAFLVDVKTDPKISENFNVIYDLNRFLKLKGLSAPFTAVWELGNTGNLEQISFIYTGKKSFLREANYSFYFKEIADRIRINFVSEVRLSGLLNLFFTVEIYDKNMGYYINGLTGNLIKKLES